MTRYEIIQKYNCQNCEKPILGKGSRFCSKKCAGQHRKIDKLLVDKRTVKLNPPI